MLRGLILFVVLFSQLAHAAGQVPAYQEPSKADIARQTAVINSVDSKAEKLYKNNKFVNNLKKERGYLSAISPGTHNGYNLPKFYSSGAQKKMMDKVFAGSKKMETVASQSIGEFPLILVSLSMPEKAIKGLMDDAYRYKAAIVLRGVIGGDIPKTIAKLRKIAGPKEQGGVLIDPTLFDRFHAKSVPTFVMPMGPIQRCDSMGCPTPKYVKATGMATLPYFLRLVARVGSDAEKKQANRFLAREITHGLN